MIAFIPARGGSKRIPRKNLALLAGHPLIAYTISAARDAGIFDAIYVSTEDAEIARVAQDYGADLIERPAAFASDTSTDLDWLTHAIETVGRPPLSQFAILRPTSPFRTAATIQRCWREFRSHDTADSIRAVELVTQHPGKMWTCAGPGYPLTPVLAQTLPDGTPWHSAPTQVLPPYYVQNASLEMGWGANVWTHRRIAGRKVAPFFTQGYEGFDVNHERDLREAAYLCASGAAQLPPVSVAPVSVDLWAV